MGVAIVLIVLILWVVWVPVAALECLRGHKWGANRGSTILQDFAVPAIPAIIVSAYVLLSIATAEPEQPEREVQYKPSAEQVKLILSPPVTEEVQAERDEIKARLLQRAKEVVAERNAKLSQ
jgi:hypothetical protein